MTKYVNQIDLRGDGRVMLYQREGLKSPKWQCRIRVPNATGYKVVSTKTDDQRAAERFALNLYEDLYMHVKAGGSVKSKTFKQVFEEWKVHVRKMGPTRRGGSWEATINRVETYAVPFFGSMNIDGIKESDFTNFWSWRKSNYNKKVPSNGTLKRERTSILPVFKYALAKGYLTTLPTSNAPKSVMERRPTFTLEEYRTLYKAARKWVAEGQSKSSARQRFVAHMYFLTLSNTGMRIGELRGLRWGDLRSVATDDGTRLIAEVRGKTGVREVVFQSGADKYIERLYDKRIEELGDPPDSNQVIFCHRDGSPILTFKTAFNALLEFAGIPLEKNGSKRSIYSLRHFYATMRLSNDTSPFLLAKQMGTSVEMLEKFYGQTVTSKLAAEVSKGNQTVGDGHGRVYPFA